MVNQSCSSLEMLKGRQDPFILQVKFPFSKMTLQNCPHHPETEQRTINKVTHTTAYEMFSEISAIYPEHICSVCLPQAGHEKGFRTKAGVVPSHKELPR